MNLDSVQTTTHSGAPDTRLKGFGAKAFYAMFKAIGVLPWRLLYVMADLTAWLASDVVRYRRKVVEENLRTSFPGKDAADIRRLSKGFYRHLGSYFVETAKMSVMDRRSMARHLEYVGLDKAEADIKGGKDVTLLLGHYANWEWISSIPAFGDGSYIGGQIYHPLENEAADRAFLRLRSRFGAVSVRMASTIRTVLGWRRDGRRSMVGYIADQSPMAEDTHLWVDFLNHDTPVFTGAERIARKLAGPIYYLDITRPERGRYRVEFIKICDDASKEELFSPTREYYRLLEHTIRRQPEMWLWSHRRWKRTRADFQARWGDRAGSRLTRI